MNLFRALFIFILCYLAACPWTDLVSLDMRETEWTNALTYVWLLGGWLVCWVAVTLVILAVALTAEGIKRVLK